VRAARELPQRGALSLSRVRFHALPALPKASPLAT
jgi:hypothetical protein